MSRTAAIRVLTGLALVFAAVSLWGISDVAAWLSAMSQCQDLIVVDTSSFWFVGALAVIGFPLLAVFKTPKSHKVLLSVQVVWFIAAPLLTHQYFLSRADVLGYDAAAAASPFHRNRAELINRQCSRK